MRRHQLWAILIVLALAACAGSFPENGDGSRTPDRAGVTDVDGLGDAAFFPNHQGDRELVVQAGGEIFAVTVFTALADPSPEAVESVAGLAMAIAANLG